MEIRPFKITNGALQGDTLAPFLFIVHLDYVLKNSLDINSNLGFTLSQSRKRCNREICITDIDYADDIAISTDSVNAAMILLHTIEEKSSYIGLKINTDKTEYITLNHAPPFPRISHLSASSSRSPIPILPTYILINMQTTNTRPT